jgi:hypothetical protein
MPRIDADDAEAITAEIEARHRVSQRRARARPRASTCAALHGDRCGSEHDRGRFVVGAFLSDNIALRLRQATTILLGDSRSTNFTQNTLIILADTRAALYVWNPASFVKGTLS